MGVEIDRIQYLGEDGITQCCLDAIGRVIQFGDRIVTARLLSCRGSHAFFLRTDRAEWLIVKAGFGSGYPGEGPRGLSTALRLLDAHGTEIYECNISPAVMRRLNRSALTKADVSAIMKAPVRAGGRWHDYIQFRSLGELLDGSIWRQLPLVIPFALIDSRIMDLALSFWDAPDDALTNAFRKLEHTVRERTQSSAHGATLFRAAFSGPNSPLYWPGHDLKEHDNRAQLFAAAYSGFRNPRAHRELHESREEQLAEFLTVNHLFRLERVAVQRNFEPENA